MKTTIIKILTFIACEKRPKELLQKYLKEDCDSVLEMHSWKSSCKIGRVIAVFEHEIESN
jgi:hypothetical protein